MSKSTNFFRIVLIVVAWIIFAGLGIEAGALITSTIATLLYTPEGATRFWTEVDLSKLYHFNQARYVTLTSIMVIGAILKTLMFYFIVKISHDKRLNLSKPFTDVLMRFVSILAWFAFGIGIFSLWGAKLVGQLAKEGVELPDIQKLRLAGADVWLFMGVTLLIIAFILKKGIEIQNENDLTV